ncbi:MAG: phosphatase PAP2 family protein [Candidatus Pelagadaptatus aseana]|uniref:phosphatase PAP2 family protein n=1 Tax=Candidatus Pelagadaptatus aseana TaxID=3120508 RepID=UPI0039B2B18D
MGLILEKMNDLDSRAFVWVNTRLGNHFERLVKGVSRTGDGYLYVGIGLLLLWLEPQRGTPFFMATLCAYGIELTAYLVLKNGIKRERPQEQLADFSALIKPSDKFSFPSGHTAAAFVFAFMVFQFYPAYSVIAFVWAALIGLSRVLLGVHYPGDILAGMVLGVFSASQGLAFYTSL